MEDDNGILEDEYEGEVFWEPTLNVQQGDGWWREQMDRMREYGGHP